RPRGRHSPLRGRRLAHRAPTRFPRAHGAIEGRRGPRGVGPRAARRRPRGAGARRARAPGPAPVTGRSALRVAMYTTARARCGIADYSAALLPALRAHVAVETVVLRPNRLNPFALAVDARRLGTSDVAHVQHTYSFF